LLPTFLAAAIAVAPLAAWGQEVSVLALFRQRALLVIDGQRRLLHAGETSPEGVRLIEANSEEAVLEAAGRRWRQRLGSHIGSTFAPARHAAVQVWPDANGMYAVIGSINSYPVDFIVDTGATFISMSRQVARRLGIDYQVRGEPAVASTAAGLARVYMVRLDSVKIGEIELHGVAAAVHDSDFPRQVLLGLSFLDRVDLRRAGKALELRRRF